MSDAVARNRSSLRSSRAVILTFRRSISSFRSRLRARYQNATAAGPTHMATAVGRQNLMRPADELKTRVEDRVSHRLGAEFLDRLNDCFMGTIHAYCFRLLQRHIPKFEAYDVLDERLS